MTRKAKIGIGVAVMVVGVALASVFLSGNENELRISYGGVASDDSNKVIFVISNTSSKSLISFGGYVNGNTNWETADVVWRNKNMRIIEGCGSTNPDMRIIDGHSSATNTIVAIPDQRWVFSIFYCDAPSASFTDRARMKLVNFADRQGWPWAVKWTRPRLGFRFAHGPNMLGNKPVAEGEK